MLLATVYVRPAFLVAPLYALLLLLRRNAIHPLFPRFRLRPSYRLQIRTQVTAPAIREGASILKLHFIARPLADHTRHGT